MVAFDGLPLPTEIQLTDSQKDLVRKSGPVMFMIDGRIVEINRHDLDGLEIKNLWGKIERSVIGEY